VTVDLGESTTRQHQPHRARFIYDGTARSAPPDETSNQPKLRMERGRWRQRLEIKFLFEDLPREVNRVTAEEASPERPAIQNVTAIAAVDSATLASRNPRTSAASEAGTCARKRAI
jgi:hypothetical protein